jgi:hypothetical protein
VGANLKKVQPKGGGDVPLIQIFKAGTHTDMNGETWEFSEQDVRDIARTYSPDLYEAPCVIGHPKTDDPAYGWAKGLLVQGDVLLADVDDVVPEFAEMVNAKMFKKVSAKLYPPGSPGNYTDGWGLCHIGFLGAKPPAVKGLKPAELAGDDEGCVVVEFGEAVDRYVPRLFQRLREFLIEEFGTERADHAIDPWDVSWLTEEAAKDLAKEEQAAAPFAEHNPNKEEPVSEAQKQREADLKAREEKLRQQEAAFAEAQAKSEADAFVDGLIAEGKLTKGMADGVAAFMSKLPDGDDDAVAFAEGDNKETTPREFFKELLTNLGTVAEFGEVSADDGESADGMSAEELAKEAVAFMASERSKGIEITSSAAVAAVRAGNHRRN